MYIYTVYVGVCASVCAPEASLYLHYDRRYVGWKKKSSYTHHIQGERDTVYTPPAPKDIQMTKWLLFYIKGALSLSPSIHLQSLNHHVLPSSSLCCIHERYVPLSVIYQCLDLPCLLIGVVPPPPPPLPPRQASSSLSVSSSLVHRPMVQVPSSPSVLYIPFPFPFPFPFPCVAGLSVLLYIKLCIVCCICI